MHGVKKFCGISRSVILYRKLYACEVTACGAIYKSILLHYYYYYYACSSFGRIDEKIMRE